MQRQMPTRPKVPNYKIYRYIYLYLKKKKEKRGGRGEMTLAILNFMCVDV